MTGALTRATFGLWNGGPLVTRAPPKRRPSNDYVAKSCPRAWRTVLLPPCCAYIESARALALVVAADLRSCGLFAFVSVTEEGGIFLTTKEQEKRQRARGLSICEGCGNFYATHAAGLSNHWRLTSDLWCSAAYERARNKEAAADEQSLAAPEAFDSAQWRGAGLARPSAWRAASSKSSLHHPGLVAARDGDLDALQALVSSGQFTDVKGTVDAHGSGSLLWAAGGGHLSIVKWLRDERLCDPGIERRKTDGRMALHWAARNGHLHVVKYLVEECACEPDVRTFDGETAFMYAVWQGRMDVVEYLVDLCKVDVHTVNRWGCNALFKAARMDGENSSLSMLTYLIESKGLDERLINKTGHSLLHKAAIYGRHDVIDYLLSGRTRCQGRACVEWDDKRQRPSDMARFNGFPDLAGRLRHLEDVWLWSPVLVAEAEAGGVV